LKKLKTLVIDDERKLREVLCIKLQKHCPSIEVVGQASNALEAQRAIEKHKPDLIFLDIAMPGKSGFELLSSFDKVTFEVIFATGYNEYAIDALKVSAVDYLLKPIQTEELIDAVSRAEIRITNRRQLENIELLKHNLKHVGDQKSKIVIPGSESYRFIEVADIIRCEGWQKYTKIYLVNGSTIVSSYNIGSYKDMLAPYGFFSCHKSHLINRTHLKSYTKEGTVTLTNDNKVPVARRKREEFSEFFLKNLN